MFKIDPDMTQEEITAYFDALPEEEKRALVRTIVSGINALVFDVMAADTIAKNNGRVMPTEADFAQAMLNGTSVHNSHATRH